jgi:tol-pal system protein YbgF
MRSRAFLALPAFALVAHVGCGGGAEERQLDSMRDEIDKLRESRDRADHAGSPGDPPGPSLVVPQAYTGAAAVAQPPPVLQLGTDGPTASDEGGESADPQDTTPRPIIRLFGSARGGQGARHGEDQIELSAPDDDTSARGPLARADGAPSGSTGRATDASSLDPQAKRAYDAALSLVNARRFDVALDALAAFLVKWPDHPYANNAMYWRGECYFARGDYQLASDQFEGVLKRFPSGNKVPDALLKLGMSSEKLGKMTKAKDCFDRLARQFPESDAARHIPTLAVAATSPSGPTPEEGR